MSLARRNFWKISKKKILLIAITAGFVLLTYLFLITSQFDVQERAFTKKFCSENSGRETKTLSKFFRPDQDTAIIVPKLFDEKEERNFIATFVLSSPAKSRTRQAIRTTWGSAMKPIFVLGRSSKPNVTAAVEREAEEFNDILVEDFLDTYDNLTLKTGFAMKYFIRHNQHARFFFKIDDDVLVNVENLMKRLRDSPKNALIGYLSRFSRPMKSTKSKWFMPDCMYADEYYPDYLQGAGYIIPGHFVEAIFKEAQQMNFFSFEDIFWTGIVAGQKLKMKLHDDTKFEFTYFPEQYVYKFPCLLSDYVAVHKISRTEMIETWQKLHSEKCSSLLKFISKMSERWI